MKTNYNLYQQPPPKNHLYHPSLWRVQDKQVAISVKLLVPWKSITNQHLEFILEKDMYAKKQTL